MRPISASPRPRQCRPRGGGRRRALRTGQNSGGIDPVAELPDGGVVTKANVSQFTAQWPG